MSWIAAAHLRRRLVALGGLGAGALASSATARAGTLPPPPAAVLLELDELHENPVAHKDAERVAYEKASALAKAHGEQAGVLYRAARAAYNLSQASKGKPQEAALLSEALALVQEAKRLDGRDSDVRRWSGIILQQWSEGQSTREYILTAYDVKAEWLAAVQANRRDARSWHLLGRWAAAVATMPYWKRSLASAIFAAPPAATMAEAREYFVVAEAIAGGDWIDNRVWLARCAQSLGKPADAVAWASAALELPARSAGDVQAHDAALTLLRELDPAKAKALAARGKLT